MRQNAALCGNGLNRNKDVYYARTIYGVRGVGYSVGPKFYSSEYRCSFQEAESRKIGTHCTLQELDIVHCRTCFLIDLKQIHIFKLN